MVVVGVLPAAGFSQIVRIVHSTNETERWLQVAQDQWAARQRRLDERLHSPNYAADTTARLQKGFGAAVFDVETSPRTYSYLTALPSVQAGAALQPPSGDGLVRWVLGWNLFSSKATPAAWPPYGETRPTSGPISALTVVQSREWAATSGPLVLAGAGILIFAVWAIYWARHKLLAHPTPAASLEIAVAGVGQATDAVLLLIGPPMTKKDDELLRVVRDTKAGVVAERIRLLYAKLTPEWVEAEATRVDQAVKLLIPKNEKSTPFWIHVSNLEAQLVDAGARYLVFDLLQRLGSSTAGERRVVAVTSSVDPIAHFEEIFDDERKRIYRDPVPEVALSRSALLLSKVRRCYMPISKPEDRLKRCRHAWDQWWSYDPYKWRETLKAELAGLAPLKPIHDELLALWEARATQSPDDAVPFEEIVETIRLRAAAYYQLLWTICTRSEKLVLIQLAQEGFVVEQSWDVVAPLIAKGIVVERPIPAIFNRTFRDFLLDIERDAVIQEWERGDGHGLWLVSSRLIGSSLVAGLLFFLLTQDVSVQSLLPVVSGTGVFSVPLVRSLIARFSPKSAGSTA
jgi:hypothetical protein